MIIGEQKSGTTALHYYLNQHPMIVGSQPKEIRYFHKKIDFGYNQKWYETHFKSLRKNLLHFEATPEYIYYENAAKEIKNMYPDIKLILILRNPVERTYSAWNMYKDHFYDKKFHYFHEKTPDGKENPLFTYFFKDRTEFPSLRECLSIELKLIEENGPVEPSLLRRGLYYEQIRSYLKYFNKDQLMILGSKDLSQSTDKTLNNILNFLGLSDYDWSNVNTEKKHNRKYDEKIDKDLLEFLEGFFDKPNQKLFNFIEPINW
ncbi:hypothetical protein GCM10009001_24590 [Virgibacillus siamensis]|uniref:Sulfotransferase domain-containing protein n=2 Tax=Virgibacillus siamensis TaxID=480071 RepID=A0ABN1G8Y2_9BACI